MRIHVKAHEAEQFFERRAAKEAARDRWDGLKAGVLMTAVPLGMLLALLCAAGLLTFTPPSARDTTTTAVPSLVGTGPLGDPAGPVPTGGLPAPLDPVPGLPPAGGSGKILRPAPPPSDPPAGSPPQNGGKP